MTKAFSTKRALLASVLSLLLCVSMLIGSTFAWFTDTDSVATGNIVSGTLDVEIVDADGNEKKDELKFLDVNGKAPEYWEPGATFKTETFAIKNNGNLNLKFKLDIRGAKISEGKLNEVITFTLVNNDDETESYSIANTGANNTVLMEGIKLEPGDTSADYYIKATMSPDAGNDYQKLTLSGLNIVVYATQMTGEYDINGNDYDKEATYDDEVVLVSNADEFVAAFSALEPGQIISLTGDIDMTEGAWTPVANKGFVLNGNGHTITGMKGPLVGTTAALEYTIQDVTFKNLTVDGVYGGIAIGGIIAYADTCAYINMTNVTIDGATIGGAKYVGGFAGYTSGYGVDTNGPVNASHNFTNCTIKNSILTSNTDGSVGGLIGHAGSNKATTTRVNGFTYLGLALKNDARPDKTGNMIGTANVGIVYINDADIDVKYDLGRFVPDTTGKLYINDVDTPAFANTDADPAIKVEIAQDQTDLNNAITNATPGVETVVTLPKGDYTLPILTGKDIVISGDKDTVISAVTNVGSNGAELVFDGVTVVFDNDGYEGFQHSKSVVYRNCTIVGTQFLYSDTEFINCTFEVYNETTEYNVWTYGVDATFTNCTFNASGKAILVYNEGEMHATVTVKDCIFNDNGNYSGKAAIEVGESAHSDDTTYEIIIDNCTVNGFDVNPDGISTGSTLWGNKNSMDKDHLSVVIDGEKVY